MSKTVAKRTSYKNHIIRTAKFLSSSDQATASRTALNIKLENLNNYWEKFLELHSEVEAQSGEQELPFQENEFIDTERVFNNTKEYLLKRIDELRPTNDNTANANGNQPNQIIVTTRAEMPLPSIQLPIFSGSIVEWMEFYALFSAHIHNKANLSAVQKFQYLKSKLDGEAAQLVRHYPLTDANYEIALQNLINRYQNKRVIAYAFLKKLFNQSVVRAGTSQELRRLIDTTNDCVRALQALDIQTNNWDPIIVYLLTEKLDTTTIVEWEKTLTTPDLPTLKELTAFIEVHCRALEAATTSATFGSSTKGSTSTVVLQATVVANMCVMCNEDHSIRQCQIFLKMSVQQRNDAIRSHKLCFNCLKPNHSSRYCRSQRCQKFSRKHDILLHSDIPDSSTAATQSEPTASTSSNQPIPINTLHNSTNDESKLLPQSTTSIVLLATASVLLQAHDGSNVVARALLDTGSQASFVSEELVNRLKLKRAYSSVTFNGLGAVDAGVSRGSVKLQISSRINSFSCAVNGLIVKRITSYVPNESLKFHEFSHLSGLKLADEKFYEPGKIDVLLGADVHGMVILNGIKRGSIGTPVAQCTTLGWIVSGIVGELPEATTTNLHVNFNETNGLDQALKQFWEIETIAETKSIWTDEERTCETLFLNTLKRNSDGRFVVQLPLKQNIAELGLSKPSAVARLKQLERKFIRNPNLKQRYVAFLREYESMGHMTRVDASELDKSDAYYIPHHAVIKEDSTTTKLRVVFDASNKSSSGISLNDCLMVGPTIQPDLYQILLRFRRNTVAISADISKMYRQIIVDRRHQDWQRIVWRGNETDCISVFRLCTVTYGTSAAPFLAIRSLNECAEQVRLEHKDVFKVMTNDMYVDDLISGADDEQSAITLQQTVSTVMAKSGFELRKWASNCPTVLAGIPENHREVNELLQFADGDSIKALGIHWSPHSDTFRYQVKSISFNTNPTKRSVLADTARLFDPLGLLSPVIVTAKIMMQKLWLLGIGWDVSLPDTMCTIWNAYCQQLRTVENLRIPRWIGTRAGSTTQFHGFCDASESAYAAVIYARTTSPNGEISVNIITAKTKVAPVQQITLPRLELCGAVLLSQLMAVVTNSLDIKDAQCFAWTDSSVVLAWLQKLPCNWKTFVANRVATIQATMSPSSWKHVPSIDNPADVASRGVNAAELVNHSLWWHGPPWLHSNNSSDWPTCPIQSTNMDVKKKAVSSLICTIAIGQCELIDKYSSVTQLIRITAMVKRFIYNSMHHLEERRFGAITMKELHDSSKFWISNAQQSCYLTEISCLSKNEALPRRSQLLAFEPIFRRRWIDSCWW